MPTMNIQISLKFHAVCAASKVLQNYNDLGLKELKDASIGRAKSCATNAAADLYAKSLSRLSLRVARLYLHCGISHWAGI